MPQSALISPPSLDLPRAPPPLDLQNLGLSPSSHEDADEQISKLLKNQHQQPGARKEDHKQPLPPAPAAASATPSAGGTSFDVFDAARQRTKVSSGSLKSPEPPVINPVKSAIAKSAAASLFNDNVPSPSMPVLLPPPPLQAPQLTDELLETAPFSSADDTEADIKRLQENKVTLQEVNVFSLLLFSVIKGSMQDKLKVFFSVIFWRPISVEEVIV